MSQAQIGGCGLPMIVEVTQPRVSMPLNLHVKDGFDVNTP